MSRFLTLAALGVMLTACAHAEPRVARWSGVYSFHFETVAFHPAGSDEQWWVVMETDQAREALNAAIAAAPGEGPWGDAFVTIEGAISAPGQYGHMGAYQREVRVTRVLSASPPP